MCGICFTCSLLGKSQTAPELNSPCLDPTSEKQHDALINTLFADPLLHRRGPDVFTRHAFTLSESLDGYMQGCVLHLRGHITPQPVTDVKGNALMWNGEIFDGIQVEEHENDTQVLFKHLTGSLTEEDILKTLQKVHGPWAFIFWQADTQKLWFGRDMFGRRSLLWHLPASSNDHLVLSSVALGGMTYTEIPSVGIFCLNFSKVVMCKGDSTYPSLTLYPWKHCRWPGTSVRVIGTEDMDVLTYLYPNLSSCFSVHIDSRGILDSWIHDVNIQLPGEDWNNQLPVTELNKQLVGTDVNQQLAGTHANKQLPETDGDKQLLETELNKQLAGTRVNKALIVTDVNKQLSETGVNQQLSETDGNQQLSEADGNQQLSKADVNQQLSKADVNQQLLETDVNQQLLETDVNQQLSETGMNQQLSETNACLAHHDFDMADCVCLEDMLVRILKTRPDLDALAEELIQVLQMSVDKRVNNLPRESLHPPEGKQNCHTSPAALQLQESGSQKLEYNMCKLSCCESEDLNNMASKCSIFQDCLHRSSEHQRNCAFLAVNRFQESCCSNPECDMSQFSRCKSGDLTSCAKAAVLFSGGLDSTILAALADRCVPEGEPIDLLNVAFEQPVKNSLSKQKPKENHKKKKTRNPERLQNSTRSKDSESSHDCLSKTQYKASGLRGCLSYGIAEPYAKMEDSLNGCVATDQSVLSVSLSSCDSCKSKAEHSHVCSKTSIDRIPNGKTVDSNSIEPSVSFSDSFDVPDRQTGRIALSELNPKRRWNFVEINISQAELEDLRKSRIRRLIYPLQTVLDDSIGCAVWFAARGSGVLACEGRHKFASTARVILSGMAADEQFAGYSRHRVTFKTKGWDQLLKEIQEEMWRISARNLGRDDRIITDHGKESRFPFLDETFTEFVSSIPIHKRTDLRLPRGVGDKLLLRLCALKLGLVKTAAQPKRAIQFGSKIAKLDKRKEKGSDVCDRLV